ncbi:hypothetical protein [Stenotrophomonas sp.]|uniref:hypothetical protein n=1 Tax=Stenotrophomonas sp. TaxID=69392 RepID=UPI00289A607B|nr:hypothetical protein [Stenotrophomonas sp.]
MPSPASSAPPSRTTGSRAPLLGIGSFLVAPVMFALAYAVGQASPEVGRWLLGNAGISLGVLGASIVGVIVGLGSRVRGERWPWLGTAGAVFSSLPLGLFLLGMIFKL